MTDTEKRAIDEAGLREMSGALARARSPEMIYDFLHCLFTPAEEAHIAERWLLVREIARGTTQRDIAKMFSMSLCKITRGSREFKKENSAFKQMFALLEPGAERAG